MIEKKKANELSIISELLTDDSQQILNDFLSLYRESSQIQYSSAIFNVLYELGIYDIKNLTYKDYLRTLEIYNTDKENENIQDKYRRIFFQYLYAFDKLKNPNGFELEWLQKDCINRLSKPPRRKRINSYVPVISFEQFEKIFQYMNMSCIDNKEKMKTSFLLYLLLYTDCSISAIKEITPANFQDGCLIIENDDYELPEKYWPLFTIYSKETSDNGFHSLLRIIKKFGSLFGIEELNPQMVRTAKKQISITCSSCGESYLNIKEFWESVNNRIVCSDCAEKLKKKFNCDIEAISNTDIQIEKIEDDAAVSSIIYTYDELKNKIPQNIDYLKLHAFQIQIGKLGEAFVYDYERDKLKNTRYFDSVIKYNNVRKS